VDYDISPLEISSWDFSESF